MTGKILCERSIGETRAVAMDQEGRPFKLFIERLNDKEKFAAYGSIHLARVRTISREQGAIFIELENGLEAVLRPNVNQSVHEGMSIRVQIVAEGYGTKRPRAKLAKNTEIFHSAFERWSGSLPGKTSLEVEYVDTGNQKIESAFETALAPDVTLNGGGRLNLMQTPALMAVDIDTAGRFERGTASSRALKINRAAVSQLAYQFELRAIGGLVVVDCIGPLNKDAAQKVKSEFVGTFREISNRRITCLSPSSLGLMEASLERRYAPLSSRLLDTDGSSTPLTTLLKALRQLDIYARHETMSRIALDLPKAAYDIYRNYASELLPAIERTYGRRIAVNTHANHDIRITSL